MGLLDDAIREHLELKRRHGASESEVEHLADEVFGDARTAAPAEPVRSSEEAVDEPALPGGREAEPEPAHVEPGPEAFEPEPEAFEPEPTAPGPEAVAPAPEPEREPEPQPESGAAEPAPEPRAPRSFTDEEPWLDEPDEVPAGEALDHRLQPTEEHPAPPRDPAEEYVAPDEGPEGEDVLEETPDFLQETPEHDRLWFEQKPPRDFDFGD